MNDGGWVMAETQPPPERGGSVTSIAHVVGVDPGLVHTGVVSMLFQTNGQIITISHSLVQGPDAQAVHDWVWATPGPGPKVYIEQYRPRQHFNSDARMLQAEQDLRRVLPDAQVLLNYGITKIITDELMDLLEVSSFLTPTHHQDLKAAARIALLGMVKDEKTNLILADVVKDHLDGWPWMVSHV